MSSTSTGIPNEASVTFTEKGKTREGFVSIEPCANAYNLLFREQPKKPVKVKFLITRVISELNGDVLTLITTEQEVFFKFKTTDEAKGYHTFISDKSEVHAENKAIAQLDDEMRNIWPFPGGSFY